MPDIQPPATTDIVSLDVARQRRHYIDLINAHSAWQEIKAWKEGQEVRGRLQTIGLLRESGHEHFNGSLVVPEIDTNGVVHEVYGRKIVNNLRTGGAYNLYLPSPHAGVWNEEGVMASGGEVILCEALIDAMTFGVHGFRNVTASYGAGGFTEDHLAAFQRHGVKRVLIAYDRDDAGNQAATALGALKVASVPPRRPDAAWCRLSPLGSRPSSSAANWPGSTAPASPRLAAPAPNQALGPWSPV